MHRLSNTLRNARLDTQALLADNGYLEMRTGSQPASPQSAAPGIILVSLRFASPAAPAASGGANTYVFASVPAIASGTAVWYRAYKSDGTTALWDGSIGTVGADLNLPSTAMAPGVEVSAVLTITDPME